MTVSPLLAFGLLLTAVEQVVPEQDSVVVAPALREARIWVRGVHAAQRRARAVQCKRGT